jgi:hypothetical protein
VTEAELDCLKSHIDKHVEIDTRSGEHLLIKVISVFDGEADPDVFFDVIAPAGAVRPEAGYSLPLEEIVSVKPANP